MLFTRRHFLTGTAAALATGTLAACAGNEPAEEATTATTSAEVGATESVSNLTLDDSAWLYNADDDVYYQLGIAYCESPADESYEQLALVVPAAYMDAADNGDGTFTCTPSATGKVGDYTASTAPIVMPINTPGYSAQNAMSSYSSQTGYTSQGFVYAHAGCRGRDHGAPAGVCDLKAAVRFMRHVAAQIPGNTDRIFTFGMSGGGAQSSLMGATGDAPEYEPYLSEIGAVSGASDAVFGSMGWCPITNLDSADAAYEWMMGCTRSGLSDDEQAISDGLAAAFAGYVNDASIRDENGDVLTLEESDEGIYQAGSYYDRVKAAIETSLNDFLADTQFPYDASSSAAGGMGGGPGGGAPGGDFGGQAPSGDGGPGERPSGGMPGARGESSDEEGSIEEADGISREGSSASGTSLSGTYETAQDYIDALNADGEWVSYDESTNTATVSSVEAFALACKQASKSLGAFDQLDRGQGENTLFGYGDGEGAHFDQMLADVLDELGSDYAADYAEDLARTDEQGLTPTQRLAMYSPLHYLLESQDGYQTSTPAVHWRIRSGIAQSDTALTTELNLAMALANDTRVESVDFAAVWGQQHTQAERTGSATDNFVSWVHDCMAK